MIDPPHAREQLQDAVLHAQETSNAFNDQVLSEHEIFRATKRHEMKALLGAFADGQIRMHKQSAAAWDRSVFSFLLLLLSSGFSRSLSRFLFLSSLDVPLRAGSRMERDDDEREKEAPQMD